MMHRCPSAIRFVGRLGVLLLSCSTAWAQPQPVVPGPPAVPPDAQPPPGPAPSDSIESNPTPEPGWGTTDDASSNPVGSEPSGDSLPHVAVESSTPADVGWSSESKSAEDWGPDAMDGGDVLDPEPSGVVVHGFAEGAFGSRVAAVPGSRGHLTLAEARARLDVSHERQWARGALVVDVVADQITNEVSPELREATVHAQITPWWEFGGGRRVITWGTGDLVFLNDLFPKDYVSFFVGRASEFYKAPVTHLRSGWFSSVVNVDLVWMPVPEPDVTPDGRRLSPYSPSLGRGLEPQDTVAPRPVPRRLSHSEVAARVHSTTAGVEWALYGYVGHTKQATAWDSTAMQPLYSRLRAYGASLRLPLLGGVTSLEGAYYDVPDEQRSDVSNADRSELRGLAAYDHELVSWLTAGVQYYTEWRQDEPSSMARSPDGKHWVTCRLTGRTDDAVASLGAFAMFSVTDGDRHLRVDASYRLTDGFTTTLGVNLMDGPRDGRFGPLRDDSNVYLRARYAF